MWGQADQVFSDARLSATDKACWMTLVLREFDSDPDVGYTGRVCIREVTHVLRDPQSVWLQPGVVVLSLHPLGEEDD